MVFAKHLWEEACSFTTERSITFVDWRLGISYKLMCGFILYWIATSLLVTELYLANAHPVGVFSMWPTSTYSGGLGEYNFDESQAAVWNAAKKKKGVEGGGDARYCENRVYDAEVASDDHVLNFENITCTFNDLAEATVLGENHMLIVTATRNEYVSFHRKEEEEQECSVASFEAAQLAKHCPESANPTFTEKFDKCICTFSESHFVAAAETVTFSMKHRFQSRFEDGFAEVTHVRVKGREEEILTTFEGDEEIRLPMPRVLEWLGVDLDAVEPGIPALRLRGIRIGVTLSYYNFDQAPGLQKKFTFSPGEVVCIMELELLDKMAEKFSEKEKKLLEADDAAADELEQEEEESKTADEEEPSELGGWGRGAGARDNRSAQNYGKKTLYDSRGNKLGESEVEEKKAKPPKLDTVELQYFELASYQIGTGAMVVRHKDGIRLTVSTNGVISELDMALLFETFIQAFLLLNLANIICKFIAYNLLGIKSRMFLLFGEYKVNYEHEYARYAVQSIVASQAFKKLDEDGSGQISEEELVAAITESQGKESSFSAEDVKALAAFIIACGDTNSEQDGEINATEWDDLFASGMADSKSIHEAIRDMHKTDFDALRANVEAGRNKAPHAGSAPADYGSV